MFVNVILNINLKFIFPEMFLNNHITLFPQIKASHYGSLLISRDFMFNTETFYLQILFIFQMKPF